MGRYASRKLPDNLVYSLVTPQNLLGGAWVQDVNCGCMKKIVVFYLCFVI